MIQKSGYTGYMTMSLPRNDTDVPASSPSAAVDWAELLRSSGLRVTRQRVAVIDAIATHPHSDVHAVWEDLHGEMPTLSLQAVHVIVRDLVGNGVLRQIDLPGTASVRYETRAGDNHHHIRCVVCGRIEDVDCVIGEAPCLEPSHTHGMQVLYAEVVFGGLCPACERDVER